MKIILFSDLEENFDRNILVSSNNTTLLLENIDFLDIKYQKKLLFFLENNKFYIKNKIFLKHKIISITSKNIQLEIDKGNFLQSLYERLSIIHLNIPPINMRRGDILPICEFYFLHKY